MAEVLRSARVPLLAGAIAAPLLLIVIAVDGATRPGYDVWHHGVSQLVLGEFGWLERATYVICGLLFIVCSAGVRRVLAPGPGGTWGPRLIGMLGAGLVVAGVLPTDPALGYPPGEPAVVTVVGRLHILGGSLLFIGLIGACFVVARRFARDGRRSWAAYSRVTGIVVTVSALAAGIIYRLETGGALSGGASGAMERVAFLFGFVWVAVLAAHLARRPRPERGIERDAG